MSVLKSEMKQAITHDIGVRVEDAMEVAKRELAVLEGRQAAFADGAKAVEALLGHVDKDVEAGTYDLLVADHVKRYIQRGAQALINLAQQAANYRIAQTGVVRGFDTTVKLLKGIIEEEERKKQAALTAEADSKAQRPVGEHPGLSVKERRLAEEAMQAEKRRRRRKSDAADA